MGLLTCTTIHWTRASTSGRMFGSSQLFSFSGRNEHALHNFCCIICCHTNRYYIEE
eukprot:m.82920 g.82920  ORF g.82920 m.82920 type:complete len:56 (-) comp19589_c0_seq2:137-304(-)